VTTCNRNFVFRNLHLYQLEQFDMTRSRRGENDLDLEGLDPALLQSLKEDIPLNPVTGLYHLYDIVKFELSQFHCALLDLSLDTCPRTQTSWRQ
jgi:hypothetical protein